MILREIDEGRVFVLQKRQCCQSPLEMTASPIVNDEPGCLITCVSIFNCWLPREQLKCCARYAEFVSDEYFAYSICVQCFLCRLTRYLYRPPFDSSTWLCISIGPTEWLLWMKQIFKVVNFDYCVWQLENDKMMWRHLQNIVRGDCRLQAVHERAGCVVHEYMNRYYIVSGYPPASESHSLYSWLPVQQAQWLRLLQCLDCGLSRDYFTGDDDDDYYLQRRYINYLVRMITRDVLVCNCNRDLIFQLFNYGVPPGVVILEMILPTLYMYELYDRESGEFAKQIPVVTPRGLYMQCYLSWRCGWLSRMRDVGIDFDWLLEEWSTMYLPLEGGLKEMIMKTILMSYGRYCC